MKFLEKVNFKKILLTTVWILLGSASMVLLVAALYKKESKICTGLVIEIAGINNNFFIDKQDITDIIKSIAGNKIEGKQVKEFLLDSMENQLKKDVWISRAELFFDKDGKLNVEVEEKEPIARVFCTEGNSFYIDNERNILPLSNRHSARLPVFTNFPSSLKVLEKADSNLLDEIKSISLFVQKDTFLMAMIDQIAITSQRHFELIPKLGDQLIILGDASDLDQKFEKLKLFYKKVMPVKGWSKYNKINLEYKEQIVATIKGVADVQADSLRTLDMMKALADYSAKMASDTTQALAIDNANNTTDISLITKSISRGDEPDENVNTLPDAGMISKKNTTLKPDEKKPEEKKPFVKAVVKVDAKPIVKPVVKNVVQSTTFKKNGQPKKTPLIEKPKAKAVLPVVKELKPKPATKPAAKPNNEY